MLKHAVQRCHIHLPLLRSHTYWDWVARDHDKVAVGKRRLQEPGHQYVGGGFFYKNASAIVPICMPAGAQLCHVFHRQQI